MPTSIYDFVPKFTEGDPSLLPTEQLAKSRGGASPFVRGYSALSEAEARGALESVYGKYGLPTPQGVGFASVGIPNSIVNQVMDNPESLGFLEQAIAAQAESQRLHDQQLASMRRNIDRLREATRIISQPITQTILETQGQDVLDKVTGASKPAGTALLKTGPQGIEEDPETVGGRIRGFGRRAGLLDLFKDIKESGKLLGN